MTRLVLRFLLAVIVPAVLPVRSTAHAQPTRQSKTKLARSYVDVGLAAQAAGDYDSAIEHYSKAYELVPHPVLLFNIAQAHRLAGREDEAVSSYRKFLALKPKGPEAQIARDLLAEIARRKAVEARKAENARKAAEARETDEVIEADDTDAADETRKPDEARRVEKAPEPEPVREAGEARRAHRMHKAAARLGVGAAYGVRNLTFETTRTIHPPEVSAPSPSARIEGEIYPFALANPRGALRDLGLFGEYDKSLGLSIFIPTAGASASIDQAHYAIGARYRIDVGAVATIAFDLSLQRRHSIFDRSGLAMPTDLDAPDVDYTAIAPRLGARFPVTPWLTLFGSTAFQVITNTGPIKEPTSYGAARVYGIDANAGLDLGLPKQLVLRFTGEYSLIDFAFQGAGTMAEARGVTSATDRSLALAATLAITY